MTEKSYESPSGGRICCHMMLLGPQNHRTHDEEQLNDDIIHERRENKLGVGHRRKDFSDM